VGSGCRNAKAHTYLTVGDLASRASVLALDRNGMLSLLEKAGVSTIQVVTFSCFSSSPMAYFAENWRTARSSQEL